METDRYVLQRRRASALLRRVVSPVVLVVLAAVLYWLLGASTLEGTVRVSGLLVVTLLFLVFGGGLLYDVLYGGRPVLEVDKNGIRIGGSPWLPWAQVKEVRAEEVVNFTGAQMQSGWTIGIGPLEIGLGDGRLVPLDEALASGAVTVTRRLGIVPADPNVRPRAAFVNALAQRNRESTARRVGREAIEPAPFGVDSYDLLAEFDEVVAAIRRFHPVVEVSDLTSANG